MSDRKEQRHQYYLEHKDEINVKVKKYYDEHKDKMINKHHEYYLANREKVIEQSKQYEREHPEETKNRKHKYNEEHKLEKSDYNKQYREGHSEQLMENNKLYYEEHKDELKSKNHTYHKNYSEQNKLVVLTHYGKDGKCVCVKCGFSDIRALSIDHVNGGGRAHIRSINAHIYAWLIRNKFPEGFQTLCMNCQWIKRHDNKEFLKHGIDK